MTPAPAPTTFEPEYGSVVTRVLPAIVLMMSVCGAVFLAIGSSVGFAMALASFAVGAGFVGLYLWHLVYREIVFGEEEIVVRRYLFPDVRGTYGQVSAVGRTGFRLDGFPVAWHTMENDAEARRIVDRLIEAGVVRAAEDGGLDRAMAENRSAVLTAAVGGALLWGALELAGLVPEAVPEPLAAFGVIGLALVVGAPLMKRFASR